MMASSTNNPKANIKAPKDILCRPMSNKYITKKVLANTTGMVIATTIPLRQPKEIKLTLSTITSASINECTKSLTELATILGCNVTGLSSKPTVSCACARAMT